MSVCRGADSSLTTQWSSSRLASCTSEKSFTSSRPRPWSISFVANSEQAAASSLFELRDTLVRMPIDDSSWYTNGSYDQVAVSAQGGLAGRIFHSQIERGISKNDHFSRVLEIGALSGEHLPYVRHSFDSWTLSDIIDHKTGKFDDDRVHFERQDVHGLTYSDHSFDRVAAMCVVHHLDRPIQALAQMRRVCKPGGVLTIFLPVEPGWQYSLGISLTSMRRAKKLGLQEEAIRSRALQHHNHFESLQWQFREVFKHDAVKIFTWPFPFGGKYLNAFTSWHVVRSDQD